MEHLKIDIEGSGIKNIRLNEMMSQHTSFKVGGPADIFIEPDSVEELKKALSYVRQNQIPYYIIGNGTNLLVGDKGIRGAVIKVGESFGKIDIDGEEIIVECGVLLSTLSKAAARSTLTGLEFASGIPGYLGGAVAMNAGAYGGEMKDVIEWVEFLDENLELQRYTNAQMEFNYRKSIVEPRGLVVVRCKIRLKKGDPEQINSIMADLAFKRKTKQPLHLPSAGSTFKRPPGCFAGKLIEDAGLRGVELGGAQISELHCGFVVNKGEATAKDVYDLIKHVQTTVFNQFGIKMETEIKILGEF
ncbi:MAG: UDP-N-acetylenolpyruvoylglucosamine reductase [Clostridia bacterium]|jgi:UDP-N-acetylmuramate dehydrogenase|nr:UDP-N-acetylenolpyruvoylglucosamine reductase [Clostridia bacterium]